MRWKVKRHLQWSMKRLNLKTQLYRGQRMPRRLSKLSSNTPTKEDLQTTTPSSKQPWNSKIKALQLLLIDQMTSKLHRRCWRALVNKSCKNIMLKGCRFLKTSPTTTCSQMAKTAQLVLKHCPRHSPSKSAKCIKCTNQLLNKLAHWLKRNWKTEILRICYFLYWNNTNWIMIINNEEHIYFQ